MIDLTPNANREQPEAGVEPTEINGLIQARIDGKFSRREMLLRASQVGLSASVSGIMLHMSSDHAFGAAAPGWGHPRSKYAQPVQIDGPTAPPGAGREGGSLVCGMRQEPDTLHPWRTKGFPTHDVVSGVMESLLQYDSNQQLRPGLAESFSVSEDGLTYTFALRQGVTWHDGGDFTAQDFIDSWTMNMNPDFASFDQQGWDKIVEARVEGSNLVVVTSEPFAPFVSYVGGSHVLCPSSAMAAGPRAFKERFGQSLIGTGPLRFGEWARGEQIVLERNPEYWGGAPKLEQVIIRFLPDDNAQLAQLRTGEVQMAGGAGALGATRVDEALDIEDIIILEHQTLGWAHLDLKNIGFLRETAVRQALDFATPTQQIIDQLLQGRVIRSVGDIAPGTPFFNDQIQPRAYDQDQARALLS
ncbi:MAG: ABC transporter substrate-binding protein, partial [Propionibacteriaceae bacterium]|nr:ABC transporter substrate-binding protein [Propionibacteriaceae bacterium]